MTTLRNCTLDKYSVKYELQNTSPNVEIFFILTCAACHSLLQGLMNDFLMRYLSSFKNISSPSFQFCEYLNISICPVTETGSVSSHSCVCTAVWSLLCALLCVYGLHVW